ncbi:hypothetical protein PRIPAC_73540 [Pristionchus pacificus]|uniref:Uncharacterized protein n=1 Tax=Pristionchus pacificus TaxID=54126 RepID=A0A2A6C8Z8_PRIPA|nr:hypothetical protein PRIPAC_73540 [Pristionchus pacificus]|eukprot:PDM74629.1 hypothetical protein PRIPAC_41985 [Pristionchus pacificus]
MTHPERHLLLARDVFALVLQSEQWYKFNTFLNFIHLKMRPFQLLIFVVMFGAGAADMEGLFGPNGGKRPLKSYNGLYLTEDMAHRRAITRGWATWRKVETHYWTIEKINEKEVALRSSEGKFISHDYFAAAKLKDRVNEWELLTPVKNDDGTWSFKSRFDKWLSASRRDEIVGFMPENNSCERWRLEDWE